MHYELVVLNDAPDIGHRHKNPMHKGLLVIAIEDGWVEITNQAAPGQHL